MAWNIPQRCVGFCRRLCPSLMRLNVLPGHAPIGTRHRRTLDAISSYERKESKQRSGWRRLASGRLVRQQDGSRNGSSGGRTWLRQPAEDVLRLGRFQPIVKTRHTRDYRLHDDQSVVVDDAPENKCQFEYSTIDLAGQHWWTISFEAIGEDRNKPYSATAETIISQHNLALIAEHSFGYPQFILATHEC